MGMLNTMPTALRAVWPPCLLLTPTSPKVGEYLLQPSHAKVECIKPQDGHAKRQKQKQKAFSSQKN